MKHNVPKQNKQESITFYSTGIQPTSSNQCGKWGRTSPWSRSRWSGRDRAWRSCQSSYQQSHAKHHPFRPIRTWCVSQYPSQLNGGKRPTRVIRTQKRYRSGKLLDIGLHFLWHLRTLYMNVASWNRVAGKHIDLVRRYFVEWKREWNAHPQ